MRIDVMLALSSSWLTSDDTFPWFFMLFVGWLGFPLALFFSSLPTVCVALRFWAALTTTSADCSSHNTLDGQ